MNGTKFEAGRWLPNRGLSRVRLLPLPSEGSTLSVSKANRSREEAGRARGAWGSHLSTPPAARHVQRRGATTASALPAAFYCVRPSESPSCRMQAETVQVTAQQTKIHQPRRAQSEGRSRKFRSLDAVPVVMLSLNAAVSCRILGTCMDHETWASKAQLAEKFASHGTSGSCQSPLWIASMLPQGRRRRSRSRSRSSRPRWDRGAL